MATPDRALLKKTSGVLKYQGQYYDPKIELCYNRFRYYHPETGRYISEDPIGFLSGEANFFTYVSDTNAWVDLLGLSSTYRLRDERGRFRRARTVEEELMVLGPLSGRRRRDIEKRLRQRGYTAVDARSGGKVWTKSMEDGNTILIRVDPANTTRNMGYADEVSHAHKESVSSSCISNGDYGREDRPNVTKYNHSNEPLPSKGREREAHIQIEW